MGMLLPHEGIGAAILVMCNSIVRSNQGLQVRQSVRGLAGGVLLPVKRSCVLTEKR